MFKKRLISIAVAIVAIFAYNTVALADTPDTASISSKIEAPLPNDISLIDNWGNTIPGITTNDSWMSPMPMYVSGNAVFYAPYVMDATAEYRGIDYDEYGCIGGVSLMSPIDIGKKVWVKVNGDWIGPFCSVDCARRGDMYSIVVIREEVVEFDFDTALSLGMVGPVDRNGNYEVYNWYLDVEVFVGDANPSSFIKDRDIGELLKPIVYKDYFLNNAETTTAYQPRVILTRDGLWKVYGEDIYWDPPVHWYKPSN